MAAPGERHPRCKLTDSDVELIRQLNEEGIGYKKLGQKFDVSPSTIRDVVKFRHRLSVTVRG